MNNKQIAVIIIGGIGIAVSLFLTPHYKIVYLDSKNFIVTEQTSKLYKRSKGKEKIHWDRIALISGGIVLAAGALCFVLKDKKNG